MRELGEALLQARVPVEPSWNYLSTVLAIAFGVRAAIALAGDLVLYPDEIMQYLKPAHRLEFENGVIYREYFTARARGGCRSYWPGC